MSTPTIREDLSHFSSTSNTLTTAAGTQVGDWLIVIHQTAFRADTDLVSPSGGTWTEIATAGPGGSAPIYIRAWMRKVTVAGAQTITISPAGASNSTSMIVFVVAGGDPSDPIDGTPAIAVGTGGTSGNTPVGPVSPTTPDALLFSTWGGYGGSSTYTGIVGGGTVTNGLVLDTSTGSANNSHMAAAQALTASGATGVRNPTYTGTGQSSGWAGVMFAFAMKSSPVAASDSGSGDDSSLTVDKTDLVSVTDSAAGDDPIILAADTGTSTDSGTATETIVVDALTLASVTDTGSGTDDIVVANFVAFDLPETGSGTETITVDQFHFLTEDGVGDDAHSLLQQLADLTETATGTDTLIGLAIPVISDSGTGTDLISIVDIPFTQVLPPSRLGNLYDLLVMARVPQENGSPLFIEVGPIEWTDLTWGNELKAPQNLTVGCQGSTLLPDVVSRLRDLASYPSELWLYRNGRLVFAGPLLGGTDNGGDQLTLQAQGILTYLKVMWVRSDLVYKNVDQHTIVKNLVDHWQNQTYGNYGINTSEIEPSGVNRTITYLKTEQHNIAQRVEELAKTDDGFDFEVDQETRQLQVWSPSKGVDRSSGEDAVVFDSRNITNSSVMFAAGPNDIATVAFGTGTAVSGDGTRWAEMTNPELMAKFGRAGVAGSWNQVPDQSTLDRYVRGLLVPRDHMVLVPGPDAKDTLDAELFSYGVGDTVLYQPNEVLFTSAAFRIRKQTVKVTGSGQESVTLEFV